MESMRKCHNSTQCLPTQIVRETLCSMQLPYKLVTCARGSPKREELLRKYGTFQVCISPWRCICMQTTKQG